jgi:IS605 OrfB family transposase
MNHVTTSIRVDLLKVEPEADALLHQLLMRPQQAASRFAYSRLMEGMENKIIWGILRKKFPMLTSRNLNDAMRMAEGILASQRERLPSQADSLKRKVKAIEEKLKRELNRADGPRSERIKAMRRRIQRLSARRDELQAHIARGTVPPAVFGGRKLWRRVSHGLLGARDQWRERQSDQFFSRGARDCKGNPHCRLTVDDNGSLRLSVRVSDGVKQRGCQPTTIPRWLTFDVSYSYQYDPLLRAAALDGAKRVGSYNVRLMRLSPCQYRAYVTIDEPVAHREYFGREQIPTWCVTLGGVDLNLDHMALVVTDREGQFRKWKVFDYANLGELPRDKSKWMTGNIARDVIQYLKDQGVHALVIEDLKNIRHNGGHPKFNQRTVPFAYRQLIQALVRRALREGLVVKRVNPAYTSWIGQLKYARGFGVSVHVAAAYVIARRGLGFQERIPKGLIKKFPLLTDVLQTNIQELERRLAEGKTAKGDRLRKQLKTRREWARRLKEWKSCSPEAGRPWLLWITLHLVSANVSGAREALGL